MKDSPANIKINSSVLAETANAYRATIRRGLRKRRKSVTIENHKPFANTTNDNSNDYLTIEDTRLNNNIDIKKSYSSDVKDDSIDTSLNIANVQNISSTTTNICHLDDPASISADANNDPQFTIKCEIDVEEILTEVSTTDGRIKMNNVWMRIVSTACKIMFFHGCFLIKYDATFGSSCSCKNLIH